MKNVCASKDTIKRVNMQPMKWEEIFTYRISHKGLISRLHKVPLQLSNFLKDLVLKLANK